MSALLNVVVFILFAGSKFLTAFMEYLVNSISRIEQKVDSNENSIKNLNRTLEMMERKQEMVLTKQDQLSSTLHGETVPHEMPPVFTTPPLTSPTLPFPPSMTPRPSESLSEAASALDSCDLESILSNMSWSPPAISLKSQIDTSAPTFKHRRQAKPSPSSTAVGPLQPESSGGAATSQLGANTAVSSLLGAGAGFSAAGTSQLSFSAAETSQLGAGGVLSTAGTAHSLFTAGTPQPEAGRFFTVQTSQRAGGDFSTAGALQPAAGGFSAAGTPQPAVGGFSAAGTLQPAVGATGTPQLAAGGFSAAGTLQLAAGGFSAAGAAQPAAGGFSAAGTPQPAAGGVSAAGSSQLETSSCEAQSCLQNPTDICDEFPNLSEHNVGKLARALACRAVFGTEVLKKSTVTGDYRRGLKMLDKKKLTELCSIVHQHPSFSNMTRTDFNALAKRKIIPSLSHMCKELRRYN